jgi:hypothetical protein
MRLKRSVTTLVIVGIMALVICLPGAVLAKSPNPPIPGANEKLIGPMLKGMLIVGWRPYTDGSGLGDAEAFLYLEGKLYVGIIAIDVPEMGVDGFLQNTAADVPGWPLPCEIVEDYNMGLCPASRAVIFEEKDVSNFVVVADVENVGTQSAVPLSYTHVLYCQVKVSFIVPKN